MFILSTVLKREVGADKGIMVMSKYNSLVTKRNILFLKSVGIYNLSGV